MKYQRGLWSRQGGRGARLGSERNMDVKKNQTYELSIESADRNGSGVGRLNGMAVFVPYALPGERVRVLIIKAAKRYAVGKLTEVLHASPTRVQPVCPYFMRCGGCTMQHMEYREQLEIKRAQTEETLRRISHLTVSVEKCIGMEEPYAYRNKAQFPVGTDGSGRPIFGFFSPHSHRIINIDKCAIQQMNINKALLTLRSVIEQINASIYDEQKHRGVLRHIVIRQSRSTGKLMVILVCNAERLPEQNKWIELLCEALPELESLYFCSNTAQGNIVLSPDCRLLWGKAALEDEMCGVSFSLSPLSFLQVNPVQAEKLYKLALELAGLNGTQIVLDAYCGIGIMTQLFARHAAKAIGVEIIPDAIENARESAKNNGISNAEFYCGDCAALMPEMLKKGVNVLVLDPPRAGCDASLIEALRGASLQRIVYISCDPATLARDLERLAAAGYFPQRILCVDMFCQTGHVETVVLLSKAEK